MKKSLLTTLAFFSFLFCLSAQQTPAPKTIQSEPRIFIKDGVVYAEQYIATPITIEQLVQKRDELEVQITELWKQFGQLKKMITDIEAKKAADANPPKP